MSLFQRARAYAPLSPWERAILKLLESCAAAAAVVALPVFASALAHQPVDWALTGRLTLYAFSVAFLLAFVKWVKAHMDPAPITPPMVAQGGYAGAQTMKPLTPPTTGTSQAATSTSSAPSAGTSQTPTSQTPAATSSPPVPAAATPLPPPTPQPS